MQPPMRVGAPDDYQTPPIALKPLLPYLNPEWRIWEPASGYGYLSSHLESLGFSVFASDLNQEPSLDFLTWTPTFFDCIITNPPFSIKQKFLERAYMLGKPFALLLPLTTLETRKRQDLFRKFGVEIIFFDKRINFIMPQYEVQTGSSWFATAWFTWGLHIGQQMTFVRLEESNRGNPKATTPRDDHWVDGVRP